MQAMFDEVNSIEWSKLSHSHGTAEDVPRHLNALVDGTPDQCDEALNYFWEYMLHQGSRYEASPYVVRFLFEALEHTAPSRQRQLVDLLLGLAVGYGESFLPFGYDLDVEERRFSGQAWDGLFGYVNARTAYYEVHKRADALIDFIRPDYDAELRLSAAFAIANFAQPLAQRHSDIARLLKAEANEAQLHSLILCYSMLGRFAGSQADVEIVSRYLDPAYSKTLRLSAAIGMVTLTAPETPEEALQTLFSALNEFWVVTSPRENFQWWNKGDLLGYAALTLRQVGVIRRDEIAQALCAALVKSNACTFAIPETLLEVLFSEPAPDGGWKISDMDRIQRTSLQILVRTNHWRDWMISSKFLPAGLTGNDYRFEMQKFLSDIMEGTPAEVELRGRAGNVSSWDLKKHWGSS